MNKKWTIVIVCVAIIVAIITYLNFDKIEQYIMSKQWQFVDSIATIQADNINQIATGKNLVTLTKNSVDFYKDMDKPINTISVVTSEIITSVANEYTVIADKVSGNVYMIKENQKVWESKVKGTIFDIVVNKNGYVAITYSQVGYKSTIKVLKPNGEELFTTFLGSTYAIDIDIADNNKRLAIAEVNTEGIKLESNIKIVEISNTTDIKATTVYTAADSLILDIEYTTDNNLYILKDNGIVSIDKDNAIKNILEYTHSEIAYSTIENSENAVAVRKAAVGIFGSESILEIYDEKGKKEYALNTTPQDICVQGKTIALNMGNEVIFVGTNGKLIKRYKLGNQLKDIMLYDNGEMAALVFRDKIELVRI